MTITGDIRQQAVYACEFLSYTILPISFALNFSAVGV